MKTLEQIEQEEREDALKWRRDWLKYEEIHQKQIAESSFDQRRELLSIAGIVLGVVSILSMAFIAAFFYSLSGQ